MTEGEREAAKEREEGRGDIHKWDASDLSVYLKEQNRLEKKDAESSERARESKSRRINGVKTEHGDRPPE